jgi:hypothetical protein
VANRLTTAKLEAYYAAIGRFVVAWADMELCLDMLVLVAGSPKYPLPHQLSEKIDLAKCTAREGQWQKKLTRH